MRWVFHFLAIVCLFPHSTYAASVAVAGDSMAQAYRSPELCRGWGQELNTVPNLTVNDFASSGKSTKLFISTGLWNNLLASDPDYVFISFGWNDQFDTPGRENIYCSIPDYKANLSRMIDDARAIGATPLILTTPTNRYFLGDGTIDNYPRPYCEAALQVAAEKGAAAIDLNKTLTDLYLVYGSNAAQLFGYDSVDKLHFGEYGAKTVASLIADDLPSVLPSLAPSLIPGSNKLFFCNGGSPLNLTPFGETAVDAPVVLQDDVVLNGSGIVHFNGGITGNHSLTIQAGTISVSHLEIDTLTIGSGSQAVPEPSLLVLLGMGTLGLLIFGYRRRNRS